MNLIGKQNRKNKNFYWLSAILLTFLITSCGSSKKLYTQNVNKVVDTAKSYRGTPYRYGGTTRSGIDCSALIYHSYASIGVQLPRTSEAQSKIGKKVNDRNLQKGDLVFFATGRRKNKVTHAGIVTENQRGRVLFIHSSTSLGVTEDNLENRYWSKAFLFGRRVLDEKK
ncbi:C40 family peptidase [Mongoliitalea daihaiensis]|uniref:C40 family peptidase n=1 Tax=Mongoliitalea daihaiensis TaxID=2782006 RepID=UPI001F48E2D2|nr:C40 family peptidase [Mongoliitalea daihaiensis]UJP66970.1 C40 family peptidase [Mongoliitalea daihaiensis]